MKVYRAENGSTFDGFQWTGDKQCLAPWAAEFEDTHNQFHGQLLLVGPYSVKPGSWVLRGHERGDIFPVPGDMFASAYTEVTDAKDV